VIKLKLAIFGGKKTRKEPFPKYPIITSSEKKAVLEVLESGNLSTFVASPGEQFLGGKKIREFEKKFAEYIGVNFAVAFNSATSALHAAVASVGINPGKEVIVPPYTFTSTATCTLMNNSIPVFSDVKIDTYCLDPSKLSKVITPLTQAIIPVHLFGHPCDMDEIMTIARKNNLKVIEDCAQAPGAIYKNKKVGTIGDCGVFSFQETKNMMTGEGGMLVTNNEEIATVAQMVRNHGEMILPTLKQRTYKSEILGWGYRMTEIEAAIGISQLAKLDKMNQLRIKLVEYLTKKIHTIDGLKHTKYENVKHVYYVYSFSYDEEKIGISRDKFCEAMRAEGIPCYGGYVKPLYLNPLYSEKRAFAFKHYNGNVSYEKGICPIAEELNEKLLVLIPICRPPAKIKDMDDIFNAIVKIIENKDEFTQ
jgi:dTDP-4-amino-4,6-dideoxygalactose transaminase